MAFTPPAPEDVLEEPKFVPPKPEDALTPKFTPPKPEDAMKARANPRPLAGRIADFVGEQADKVLKEDPNKVNVAGMARAFAHPVSQILRGLDVVGDTSKPLLNVEVPPSTPLGEGMGDFAKQVIEPISTPDTAGDMALGPVMAVKYGGEMAAEVPEQLKRAWEAAKAGDTRGSVGNYLGAVLGASPALGAAAHLISDAAPILPNAAKQAAENIRTGQGIKAQPAQMEAPRLKPRPGKPVVPESAVEPERGVSVLEEIRQKNAKTKEDIRKIFPQISREQAAQLRNQAWPQTQTEGKAQEIQGEGAETGQESPVAEPEPDNTQTPQTEGKTQEALNAELSTIADRAGLTDAQKTAQTDMRDEMDLSDEELRNREIGKTRIRRQKRTESEAEALRQAGVRVDDDFLNPEPGVRNHITGWTKDRAGNIQVRIERHTENTSSATLQTVKSGESLINGVDDATNPNSPNAKIGLKKPVKPAEPADHTAESGTMVENGSTVDTIAGKMDLNEFERKGYTPDQVTREDWRNLQRAERRRLGQDETNGNKNAPWSDYDEYHKQAVVDALKKSEEVDPEVLKDYPDLKPNPSESPKSSKPVDGNPIAENSGQTGLKNAIGDAEREANGFHDAPEKEKRDMTDAYDRAGKVQSDNPSAGKNLADDLIKDPTRGLTDDDSALLLRHKVDTQNAMNDAADRMFEGGEEERNGAATQFQQLSKHFNDFLDALKARGGHWGREGRWRQALAARDYTFATQERLFSAAKKGPLSEKERIQLKALVDDYKAKVDAGDVRTIEFNKEIERLKAQVAKQGSSQISSHIIDVAQNIVTRLETAAVSAEKRIMARLRQTNANPIGAIAANIKDTTIVGAAWMARHGLDAAKFGDAMAGKFGDWVKPHLDDIYKRAKALSENLINAIPDAAIRDGVRRRLAYLTPEDAQKRTLDRIHSKLSEGERDSLHADIQDLERRLIRSGITDTQKLLDAVHEVLKKSDPEISRLETMDAMSGRGDFQPLDKDTIEVTRRDINGQLRELGNQEDMANGKAPPKSGHERHSPSDDLRREMQKTAEMKKAGGYTVTDPESQLKSSLASRKTRMENQIKDWQSQIDKKEQLIKERKAPPTDADLEALKVKRDKTKAEYDKTFGPSEDEIATKKEQSRLESEQKTLQKRIDELNQNLSQGKLDGKGKSIDRPDIDGLEQLKLERDRLNQQMAEARKQARKTPDDVRIAKANDRKLADLEKRIAEGEARIAARDTSPRTSAKANRPDSIPELETAKQRMAEINDRLDKMRRDATRKTPEQIEASRRATRTVQLQKQLTKLNERLANNDFSQTPRPKPRPLGPDQIKIKAGIEAARLKIETGRKKLELANRTRFQRYRDNLVDWSRMVKLASVSVYPKLIISGLSRVVSAPAHRLASQPLRLIPGMAERAPVQMRLSWRGAAENIKGIMTAAPKAWDKLRGQGTDIDALGGKVQIHDEMSNFVGNSHGMIKEPIRQGAFKQSVQLQCERAAEERLNPKDETVKVAIISSAVSDANRMIFMNDNPITKYLVTLPIRSLEAGGHTGIARTVQFLMPIVKVPTNISIYTARLNPAIGFGEAAARLYMAAKRGELENRAVKLSREDAASIARAFSGGMIGTFLAAYAWNNASEFGGAYGDEHTKENENGLKPGQLKIMGVQPPDWIAKAAGHVPEIDFLNTVASARRLYDAHTAKEDGKVNTQADIWGFMLWAPVKHLPMIDQVIRTFGSYQNNGQLLGNMTRSALVPAAIPQGLGALDTKQRKPKSFTDEWNMANPWGRSSVPAAEDKPTPSYHWRTRD